MSPDQVQAIHENEQLKTTIKRRIPSFRIIVWETRERTLHNLDF